MNEPIPVSRRCLNPQIDDDKEREKGTSTNGHQKNQGLRYDDCAMDAISDALAEEFITINSSNESGWRNPAISSLLKAIHDRMLLHPLKEGGVFRDLFRCKNAHLVVAIVKEVKGPLFFENVTHRQSAYAGVVPYLSVSVLASFAENFSDPVIKLTQWRWKVARKKFTVPSGDCVQGPYLMVAAIDNASGFTLRARMLPVWLPIDHSTFATVSSGYERMGMDAIRSLGGVAFTPIRSSQLARLQESLGRRWRGILTKYEFRPDMVLMPLPGGLICVVEIFGLTTFKPYDEGKTKKENRIHLSNQEGYVRCFCVPTKHVEKTMPPRTTIKLNFEGWYNDITNSLWKNTSGFPFLLHDKGCPFLEHDSELLMDENISLKMKAFIQSRGLNR